jgi:hypothetical protein
MKVLKLMPMGAALFALGLGLTSVAPSPARADDEDSGIRSDKNLIRIVQGDRDSDRESDRDRESTANSGYLGVQVQRLTASLRRAKGIPESTEGTLVNNVEDQSPADDGGIKRGDVILEVNHQPTPNPSDLVQVVSSLEPGKRASVLIWRDGVTRPVNIKVGSRPEGSDMAPPAPPRMPDMGSMGGVRGMPDDGTRMQILRRNRGDLEREIKDLQDQLSRLRDEDIARLEREVRELRAQVEQSRRGNDRYERDRKNNNNDRDRDNSRDNSNEDD